MMHTLNHLRVRSIVIGALGAAAAASIAQGQCPISITGVPDFDQRRQGDLPNNGSMYCVPTSVANWFAYFSNRGIPQPLTFDGPRFWQFNVNYDRATQAIAIMGNLMSTDPDDGTTGGGGHAGAYYYSLFFAQNKVSVVHHWCGGGYCPTPTRLLLAHALGGHVAFCYGRYTPSGGNLFFTRNGGHCISMNELDACSTPPTIGFRDPANDPANTTQSVFVTHTADLMPVTAFYRGKNDQSYVLDTRWRIDYGGGTSWRFLDGWFVLYPKVALTTDQSPTLNINLLRPFTFTGSSLPTHQSFNPPAGTGNILDVAIHPQQTDYHFITQRAQAGQPTKLFHLDPTTGNSRELLAGEDFRLMTFSRHGKLFIADGSVLRAFDVESDPPTLLGSLVLPDIPEALACDDDGDTVAVVVPTAVPTRKQFLRFHGDLTGSAPGSGLIPYLLTEEITFVFEDIATVYITGSGAPQIHKMSSRETGLMHLQTIDLPPGSQPMGLNAEPGHLYYSSNGIIHELMLDPTTGQWRPNPESIFDGLPGGRRLYLARSSTNHLPLLHEGPEWINLPDPEVFPGTPDCYANCDLSTVTPVLNVDDFTCFINEFAAALALPREQQVAHYANCDESTIHPVLNVDDFTCFINQFAAGCP